MALQCFDGFDHYSGLADMSARSGFFQYIFNGTNNSFHGFVPGPFGYGLAAEFINAGAPVSSDGNSNFTVVLAERKATGYIGIREFWSLSSGMIFHFNDTVAGATQISVYFNPANFSIAVYRGTVGTGTLLGVSDNNVWTGATWNFVEINVIIDSSGAVVVNVNNAQVFSVTGINTQNTANNWWDEMEQRVIVLSGGGNATIIFDDLYYLNGDVGPGPNPMNSFLGDVRTVTLFAVGNSAVQFTPFATSDQLGYTPDTGSATFAANELYCMPLPAEHAGILQTGGTLQLKTGLTGDVVVGIYDSDGPNGGPGTLLVQATALGSPSSGSHAITWGSTLGMVTNHDYYYGVLADASVQFAAQSATQLVYLLTPEAYSATLPASLAGNTFVTATLAAATILGTLTITNAGNVSEVAMDSDDTYNSSSTLNDEDLLVFGVLPGDINLVLGVQLTGAYRKDDAGTRVVKQALKSSTTEVYGADHYLSTETYVYFTDLFVLDPNTDTSWTTTGVNSLVAGYNVAV